MKILIDMNLSPKWKDIFSAHNIESVHWLSIGQANDLDTEILNYAKINDYAIFTHDLDFGTILAETNSDKPSVIQIRTGHTSPSHSALPIINSLLAATDDIEKGALVTIDLIKTRLRILPLKSNIGHDHFE